MRDSIRYGVFPLFLNEYNNIKKQYNNGLAPRPSLLIVFPMAPFYMEFDLRFNVISFYQCMTEQLPFPVITTWNMQHR